MLTNKVGDILNLSQEQLDAIGHTYGPALILAVPGAGKTTVLIHRTYNLIKNHKIDPSKILSITFSRASANDMKERFISCFPKEANLNVHFSTIHAFCYGLIREYAFINKIRYRLIEDGSNQLNKYNLLKQLYLKHNSDYITEEKLDTLLNEISYIKNMMFTVDEYLKDYKSDIDNLRTIYTEYENYKRKNRLLDFDDMLSISLEILRENKHLLNKYRNKYDFIQVDEGQDTSKIQMEIIKLIAYPKNNLFIVADDDQSIYGFRGAYPKGILNFKEDFKEGKLFFMERNYRSSKNIVSVCNKFIKSNKLRFEKNIFTDNDFAQPINIIKVNTLMDQYEYILESLKDTDLADTCILYRNNLSSVGLIEILERENIPFFIRDKKLRFFNHWVIQDIIDFMSFAQDTSNMEIYERIFYKKKGFISRRQINYAKTLNHNLSVFQRIKDFPGINSFYERNLNQLDLDFKKLSKLKPKDAISFIEYDLEYDQYLRDNSMKFGYTYDNLVTILYFLKMMAEKTHNLGQLISRLNHVKSICEKPPYKNKGVTLSTIHSAKGLEFERVYMIDLIDGEFPNYTSIEKFLTGNPNLMEEERRLFYVGMSRAKSELNLLTVKYINGRSVSPSRFLNELEKITNS